MSTAHIGAMQERLRAARPSFFGIVGGEIYKIWRMRALWICFFVLLLLICAPNIIYLTVGSSLADSPVEAQLSDLFTNIQVNLGLIRTFIGIFLIILVANVYGREYQQGTVRILLARGVGRVQLLFGKLLASTLVSLLVLAACLLVMSIWMLIYISTKFGGFELLGELGGAFWGATGTYVLTVLISMGVTILLTMAVSAIGRSMAFALTLGIIFFPADNIAPGILQLAYMVTQNEFWINVTQYLLGPNLNYMPNVMITDKLYAITVNLSTTPMKLAEGGQGIDPNPVDATHVLLVTGVYALVFLVVSIYLTAVRDVRE